MAVRKSLLQLQKDLQNKFDTAGQYWLERIPADLGNHAGVVEVPNTENMVYARVANGQVVEVFNDRAPNIADWKVYIGRDKSQPWLLKVIEVRWVYNMAETVAYVLFHHTQHEYPAPDTVWVRRDQFMPLLVLPAGGFNVRLFGDVVYKHGMSNPVRVEDADLDLSSHVVSAGAKYVLLEVDDTGALNYVTGATYGSRIVLQLQPLPTPSPNAFPIAAFEFYEGQTELRRDDEDRSIIDLRMFTSDTDSDAGSQWHSAPAETTIEDPDEIGFWDDSVSLLKKITWQNIKAVLQTYFGAIYSALGHSHDASTITGQYRQFVWVSDGSGGWEFVTSEGKPVFVLQDLE